MNKSITKKVKIPASLLAELAAIPRAAIGANRMTFTDEQKAVLIKLYEDKSILKKDVLVWWKSKYGWGSIATLDKHHRAVTNG